jgi:hypothetical protein
MTTQIVNQIPTAEEKRKLLETGWTAQASDLLQKCKNAIDNSSSMRVSVNVPPRTNEVAIKRVIAALATRGWVAEEDKYSDMRESWHKLKIGPKPK